jgi:hypothetical protein
MHSLSPLARAPHCRSGSLSLSGCGFWLLVGGAAMCASSAVWATSASQRFQLIGDSGTLNLDRPAQENGSMRLRASLTSTVAAGEASLLVQVGGRFAMTASFAASPMVCYNDTIFRDDFDGDGF